jgi:hypothetical protein
MRTLGLFNQDPMDAGDANRPLKDAHPTITQPATITKKATITKTQGEATNPEGKCIDLIIDPPQGPPPRKCVVWLEDGMLVNSLPTVPGIEFWLDRISEPAFETPKTKFSAPYLNWTKKCPTVAGFTTTEKEVEYYKEYYGKGGSGGRKQKVCLIGDMTMMLEDLDCLAPMAWLHAKIVTGYSDVLAENTYKFFDKNELEPRAAIFDSFFYTLLVEERA